MPRQPRQTTPGIPLHIVQRGCNRQQVFHDEQDHLKYLNLLRTKSSHYKVNIHAWVLMSNHIHLLCTAEHSISPSKMMQTLSIAYSNYYNKKYQRSGTLWQGRYRSKQITHDGYLLCAYRYIELNPVRAGLVNHPSQYKWSSYNCNAFGKSDNLTKAHSIYDSLGNTTEQKQAAYQNLFQEALNPKQIQSIRIT